jgi:hypothetical protein
MDMGRFSVEERARMLALNGVGATVVARLEQIGFFSAIPIGRAGSG